jgi:hypothetical protein
MAFAARAVPKPNVRYLHFEIHSGPAAPGPNLPKTERLETILIVWKGQADSHGADLGLRGRVWL